MSESASRLAVHASAFSPDPRAAAVASRAAGFAGLLFDAFSPALTISDLSATGRREFRHILTNQNQQLVGLRADLGTKGFGPGADVDRLLSQARKVMEAAAGLVAPLLCLDVGPLPEPPRVTPLKPAITQDQAGLILLPSVVTPEPPQPAVKPPDPAFVQQVDAALGELGELADRHNVTVAVHTDLSSYAAVERALDAARCPWFGVDLDPVAVLRDEWDLDEVFARLAPLVRHVRARDAVAGTDRRTKPAVIGRGDTKWDHLLANLEGSNYHGWFTFDPADLPDRPAAAIAGLKYLKLHD